MTPSRKALIAAIALLGPALAVAPAFAASSSSTPKKSHHSSTHNASHKSHGTKSATPSG